MSSGYSEVALAKINEILLDPKYHDILSILKGARNGLVYGVKVRCCVSRFCRPTRCRAELSSHRCSPATGSGGMSRHTEGS